MIDLLSIFNLITILNLKRALSILFKIGKIMVDYIVLAEFDID
jgi:hypothetical protein